MTNSLNATLPLVLGLLLMLSPAAFSGEYDNDNHEKATGSYHKELDVKSIKSIGVETVNGGITVVGDDTDKILIDADLTVKGPDAAVCQELLDKIEIRLQERKKSLNIEVERKKKHKYSISVSFNIRVPHEMSVNASTVNGGINVTALEGDMELSTVNGGINCNQIDGSIEASTVNGGLNLSSVSGDVEASTVNGGIVCNSVDTTPSSIELSAVNGSIELGLKGKLNSSLEANTMNGKIRISGIDIELPKKNAKHLTTVLGDGEGDYELNTVNGSIHISVEAADSL